MACVARVFTGFVHPWSDLAGLTVAVSFFFYQLPMILHPEQHCSLISTDESGMAFRCEREKRLLRWAEFRSTLGVPDEQAPTVFR